MKCEVVVPEPVKPPPPMIKLELTLEEFSFITVAVGKLSPSDYFAAANTTGWPYFRQLPKLHAEASEAMWKKMKDELVSLV